MFFEELKPIVQEMTTQPIAFMGGFFSGLLRLNPNEEPLKSWLEKQVGFTPSDVSPSESNHRPPSGPQSISID